MPIHLATIVLGAATGGLIGALSALHRRRAVASRLGPRPGGLARGINTLEHLKDCTVQNSQNPAAAVASFVERLGAEVEAEVDDALANIDGPPAALVGGFAARIRTARSLPVTKTFERRWNALGRAGEGAVAVFNAMKRVADTRIEAALAADPTLRDVLTDWDIAASAPQPSTPTAPPPEVVAVPLPSDTKAAGSRLLDLGHEVLAIRGAGKAPRGASWQDNQDFRARFESHFVEGDNIGIRCGAEVGCDSKGGPLYFVGLDVDFTDAPASEAAQKTLGGAFSVRFGQRPKFPRPRSRGRREIARLPLVEGRLFGHHASVFGARQAVRRWPAPPLSGCSYEWSPNSDWQDDFQHAPRGSARRRH